MMPETPGVCTRPARRIASAAGGRARPTNRTRFCENPEPCGVLSDWRTHFCACLRRNGYKLLQEQGRRMKRKGVPVSAPLKCAPYPFLRMTAPRGDSKRTRFCGNGFGSAVPVSAEHRAETGTLYLQAPSPSPWPIRLFTRRNRYGDQNAEPRGPSKRHPLVLVSAMKVQNSPVRGEGSLKCSRTQLANRHAETGTHTAKSDGSKRALAFAEML